MIYEKIGNIGFYKFILFADINNLVHFSSTIDGGVSKGNYSSLNLGLNSGDEIINVEENRKRLCSPFQISLESMFIPYQTHGDKICVIDENFMKLKHKEKEEQISGVDAIITNQKNICIGITTADCVPILIYDPENHVLASIHAGWKGTVLRIANKTVDTMVRNYGSIPSLLLAGIGPSISQLHFEVGDEVVESFVKAGFLISDIAYKNPQSNKMHIDLQKANALILKQAGLINKNIEISGLCTYSNPNMFFSARRQTIYSGRMLTGGVLS